MHYKNNIPGLSLGGLGDVFNKETGLDGKDPKNWRQLDEFALRYASKHGWNSWHGATSHGIQGMMGIGRAPGGAGLALSAGGASYSGHIGGDLQIGKESFRFGSGGVHGSASIPFGDYGAMTPSRSACTGVNSNDALRPSSRGAMPSGTEGRSAEGATCSSSYHGGGHSASLITEVLHRPASTSASGRSSRSMVLRQLMATPRGRLQLGGSQQGRGGAAAPTSGPTLSRLEPPRRSGPASTASTPSSTPAAPRSPSRACRAAPARTAAPKASSTA